MEMNMKKAIFTFLTTVALASAAFAFPSHNEQGTIRDYATSIGCELVPAGNSNAFTLVDANGVACNLKPAYFPYGSGFVNPDGIFASGDEAYVTDK